MTILLCRQKLSKTFDEPETYCFPSTSKEFFKNIYFEVYDQTINGIRERFDQPDHQIYVNLQELILQAFNRLNFTEKLERVINFYNGEFENFNLELQVQLLYRIVVKFDENNKQRFRIQE